MSQEKAKSEERAERLAAALRANLRKRKAQARQRAVHEQEEAERRDRQEGKDES